MNRRNWLTAAAAMAVQACLKGTLAAQDVDGRVSLRDRLKAGLLCRRQEEFDFVDDVVDLVDQRKLSEALVLSTYKWAVQQRPKFPFFYFRDGLRKRAAAIGVDV